MAKAQYLIQYAFTMEKLRDYKEKQNEEFIILHAQSTEILKEEQILKEGHALRNDRKTALLGKIHGIQLNIAWVVQKTEELKKLQGYKMFHPTQLDALLQDEEVKERLGNV
jgi:FtsZ-binding cell division protein ZapB